MTDRFDDMENETDEELVTLTMEDGSEVNCEIVALYPYEEEFYIALLPVNGEDAGKNTVYIYRYAEDENGEPVLENIENEEEYQAAADAFDEFMESDEYDDDFDDDFEGEEDDDFDPDEN